MEDDYMGTTINFKKQIVDLTKDLTEDKVKELITYAQFLRAKQEGFSYAQIEDSAEYVRKLRLKETRQSRPGKNYIEEIIEWQKSNC
jgi:predicted secreted protein